MKEVKHYICEVCGAEYRDKENASVCEKNHKKIVSIEAQKYLSYGQNKTGYPQSVGVKFNDGNVVKYVRG